MACKVCGSSAQTELASEIALHFRGYKNLERPAVLIFPEVIACLRCGFAEFTIPETELAQIRHVLEGGSSS